MPITLRALNGSLPSRLGVRGGEAKTMARSGLGDRLERFLQYHEGSGGAAILGVLLVLVVAAVFAILRFG